MPQGLGAPPRHPGVLGSCPTGAPAPTPEVLASDRPSSRLPRLPQPTAPNKRPGRGPETSRGCGAEPPGQPRGKGASPQPGGPTEGRRGARAAPPKGPAAPHRRLGPCGGRAAGGDGRNATAPAARREGGKERGGRTMRPAAAPAANKSSPAPGVAPASAAGLPPGGVSRRPPPAPIPPRPPQVVTMQPPGGPRHKAGRSRRPSPRTDLEPPRAPLRFWSPPSTRCSPAGRGEAPPTCSSPPACRRQGEGTAAGAAARRRRRRRRKSRIRGRPAPRLPPCCRALPLLLSPPAAAPRPPLPPSPPGRAGRRRGRAPRPRLPAGRHSAPCRPCPAEGGGRGSPGGGGAPSPSLAAPPPSPAARPCPQHARSPAGRRRAYLPLGFVPPAPPPPVLPSAAAKWPLPGTALARRGGRGGRGARWLAGACSPVADPKRF